MPNHNQTIGKMGETLARQYLEGKGLVFVVSNYRTAHGEIDLVFLDEEQRVFVEVKTRTSQKFGYGEAAVNNKKLGSLVFAAETYIEENDLPADNWRIDVVVLEKEPISNNYEILHFENVGLEDYNV